MCVVEHSNCEFVRGFELGYVIGLIVGEGSFTGDGKAPCLEVRLHVDDPEPLLKLREVFGGRIYGPYIHDGRHYRMWLLRGVDLFDALPTIFEALPPSKKRTQLERWAAQWGYLSRRRRWVPHATNSEGAKDP
jgi:hypothetical protein